MYRKIFLWLFCLNYAVGEKISLMKTSNNIDYQRYSRQMLVYGEDSQEILSNSTVVLLGSNMILIEIMKNLALSGIGKIIYVAPTVSSALPPSLVKRFIKSLNKDVQVEYRSNYQEIQGADVMVGADISASLLRDTKEYCDKENIPHISCGACGNDCFVSCNLTRDIDRVKPLHRETTITSTSFLTQLKKKFAPIKLQNEVKPRPLYPVACSLVGSVAASEVLRVILCGRENHNHPLLTFRTFESPKFRRNTFSRPLKLLSHDHHDRKSLLSFDINSPAYKHSPTINATPRPIVTELSNMTILLVGSGAIGCEILKILSQIITPSHGSQSTFRGKITIVDPDSVEKSNLNRQVLFSDADVGKSKAIQACHNLIKDFNPHMKLSAIPVYLNANNAERYFNQSFWESIDVVLTALDSVEARRYVDSQCVRYGKPLIDAGTMGLSGHVQVVLPHVTESYSSSSDPSSNLLPICSIRSNPSLPEHFVAWSKELFDTEFYFNPLLVQRLDLQSVDLTYDDSQQRVVNELRSIRSLQDAKKWATALYIKHFGSEKVQRKEIDRELIERFISSAANIIWGVNAHSPLRRSIKPFDKDDISPLGHVDFLTAATNLRCQLFKSTTLSSLKIRQLAGDIIPALSTSTTLAASLAVNELLKLVEDRHTSHLQMTLRKFPRRLFPSKQRLNMEYSLDKYRNHFFSLKEPEIISAQPLPPPVVFTTAYQPITLWNQFQITDSHGNHLTSKTMTLDDINATLLHEFNTTLSSLTFQDHVLYDYHLTSLWFQNSSTSLIDIPHLTINQCLESALQRRQDDDIRDPLLSPSRSLPKEGEIIELYIEGVNEKKSSNLVIPAPIRLRYIP